MRPTKFLIDGIDRLGKSTLIKRIQDEYGYHLVIHYDKPPVLQKNMETALILRSIPDCLNGRDQELSHLSNEDLARYLYQEHTNLFMFELLQTNTPIIFDRTHLGETVYAPLYRKYSGDYVFKMEYNFIKASKKTQDDVRLILLTSSNTDMLVDDGLSFDPAKKGEEQKMFIDAFNKSQIKNKVLVDVHDGNGGYKSYDQVFKEAMFT